MAQWWKWWIALNPPWREHEDGRPVTTGNGDWSTLFKSGRNGFLTVLASLLGLYTAAESEEWTSALVDVHWVLSEVLAAKQASGDVGFIRISFTRSKTEIPEWTTTQTKTKHPMIRSPRQSAVSVATVRACTCSYTLLNLIIHAL